MPNLLLQVLTSYSLRDFIYIPAIFSVLVVILGTVFFFIKKGDKSVSLKFFIIYSLLSAIVFALVAFETYLDFSSPIYTYLGTQAVFLGIGIFHTYLLRSFMNLDEDNSFVAELVFTLYIGLLGAAVYTFLFLILNHGVNAGYALVFASSILMLVIPFLFYRAFIYFVWIPAPVFKKWYYPVGEEVSFEDSMFEDEKMVVLKYMVQRTLANENEVIPLKVKSPYRAEFGKFFAMAIDLNNEKDMGKPIEYCDEFSQPYGWNFYVQPKWYTGVRYIDPDITIVENELKENDVIICERILD